MDVEKRQEVERRRKARLLLYLQAMKRNKHIPIVTTK